MIATRIFPAQAADLSRQVRLGAWLDALSGSDAGIPDIDDTPSKDLLGGTGDDAGLISAVDQLDAAMTTWRTEGEEAFKEAMKEIKPSLEKWNDYERRVEERINAIADDLRAKGVNPNMSELTRLTNVEAQSAIAIKEADADLVKERKLRTAREDLLKSFKQQQAARFYLRREATKRLTTLLNKSLRKFKVKISFRQAARVDLYEEWLRATMAARVFRGPRATAFCREIGPSALASALRKKQFEVLTTIEDDKGNKFFSKRSEAEDFAALVSPEALNELETIEVSDLPEITLTETVARKPRSIDFENLSFGQQASILLGMLLFAENVEPLIIDQPEDHLDSAFISETVVATLRQVKERRQVILATHNANIAVLGDAELIVPMQGFAGKGDIRDSGSVDSTATSARACEILEGGEAAFLRRGQMYGLPRS